MQNLLEICNKIIEKYETYAPFLPEYTEKYKEEYEKAKETAATLIQRIDSLNEHYIEQARQQVLTYKIPDNVTLEASGDSLFITFIQNCSEFIINADALSQLAEYEGIESIITIRETGTESEAFSDADVYNYYISSTITSGYQTDAGYSFTLGTLFDLIPGGGELYSLYELGNAAADETPYDINFELYDKLGGTYTKATFIVEFDWDFTEISGGGEHEYFEVTVYYGEPIILADGQVIENPLSGVYFQPIKKS